MTKEDLQKRTKKFAIETIIFLRSLPKDDEGKILKGQLIRSATSVGSNYRAACRGKSTADFVNKITIIEEEADECCYWFEIIEELGIGDKSKCIQLLKESKELTAIFTATARTTKENKLKTKP